MLLAAAHHREDLRVVLDSVVHHVENLASVLSLSLIPRLSISAVLLVLPLEVAA
jgi:hypothetical protein